MKSMLKNIPVLKSVMAVCLTAGVSGLIGFTEHKQSGKVVGKVLVNIDYQYDNYFVGKEEVMALMSPDGHLPLSGMKLEEVNLKALEQRIKAHKFVEDAQVFRDYKGNLMVEVKQCRPLARVIRTEGSHAYIGEKGNTLAISDKFAARVLLIDGPFSEKLLTSGFLMSEEGRPYFELVKIIDADKFWKAQIAQLSLNRNGEIRIHSQVGSQVIDFGKPENVEGKLKKLRIFYKEILPSKGWNHYAYVNLKYKDQIICE